MWNYIYIDDIDVDDDGDGVIYKPVHDVVGYITYDLSNDKCYIHSNTVIEGLTLFKENADTIPHNLGD